MAQTTTISHRDKTHYVLGFMFNPVTLQVVLICKRQGHRHEGMLNGVGGKVEPGEDNHTAMSREFEEETGISTTPLSWLSFATIGGEDDGIPFVVHCFYITVSVGVLSWAKTTTDEGVGLFAMDEIVKGKHNVLDSSSYLITALVLGLHKKSHTHLSIHTA